MVCEKKCYKTASLKKIEILQKRAMRFLYNKILYKRIKNANPSFMKQIFELRKVNRNAHEKYAFTETRFFIFLSIIQDLNKIKKSQTPFCRHH